EDKNGATNLIGLTDDIPTEMVFLRRDLPDRKRARLRAALLSIGEREFVVKSMSRSETEITGVAPADPRALERVSKVLQGIPEAFEAARRRAKERAAQEQEQKQ
ncbi:MAG: hypothetical protein AAF658_01375, partial [Myxococcota bacterium]